MARLDNTQGESSGERIAKVIARSGVCSRREAEELIEGGRVAVNGKVISSPALDVTPADKIEVDGAPLPARQAPRLWRYHKPKGRVTTHKDPEGRPTVFEALPENLPRVVSVGRLDYNTEGLLLLTNDGDLARHMELPSTGWARRYRVRAYGIVDQAALDKLSEGLTVDGVNYGPIEASVERDQGDNVWIALLIREGKNREVRKIMDHLGLTVNRLIRVSFGPFILGELEPGQVEEVKTRILQDQLGPRLARQLGVKREPLRETRPLAPNRAKPTYLRRKPEGGERPYPEQDPAEARAPRQRRIVPWDGSGDDPIRVEDIKEAPRATRSRDGRRDEGESRRDRESPSGERPAGPRGGFRNRPSADGERPSRDVSPARRSSFGENRVNRDGNRGEGGFDTGRDRPAQRARGMAANTGGSEAVRAGPRFGTRADGERPRAARDYPSRDRPSGSKYGESNGGTGQRNGGVPLARREDTLVEETPGWKPRVDAEPEGAHDFGPRERPASVRRTTDGRRDTGLSNKPFAEPRHDARAKAGRSAEDRGRGSRTGERDAGDKAHAPAARISDRPASRSRSDDGGDRIERPRPNRGGAGGKPRVSTRDGEARAERGGGSFGPRRFEGSGVSSERSSGPRDRSAGTAPRRPFDGARGKDTAPAGRSFEERRGGRFENGGSQTSRPERQGGGQRGRTANDATHRAPDRERIAAPFSPAGTERSVRPGFKDRERPRDRDQEVGAAGRTGARPRGDAGNASGKPERRVEGRSSRFGRPPATGDARPSRSSDNGSEARNSPSRDTSGSRGGFSKPFRARTSGGPKREDRNNGAIGGGTADANGRSRPSAPRGARPSGGRPAPRTPGRKPKPGGEDA